MLIVTDDVPAPRMVLSTGEVTSKPVKLDEFYNHHFWRFDIKIRLTEQAQFFDYSFGTGLEYRVNVPGLNEPYKIAFFSCNGFSSDVSKEVEEQLDGIRPLWADIQRDHAKAPFHAMLGGGGIYW